MNVRAEAGRIGSDHEACAREPIHTPGAVQAHAYWFAVNRTTRRPCGVSDSLCALLGLTAEEYLRPEGLDAFDAPSREAILSLCPRGNAPVTLRLALADGTGFDSLAYGSGEVIKFDLESEGDPAVVQSAVTRAEGAVAALRNAQDFDDLYDAMAHGIADMTGFDRVMIYRFDQDWNGDVVAEISSDGAPASLLELKFPATDIPSQARALFLRNRVRQIVNVSTDVSAITPTLDPTTGEPWDLSDSQVRAVSPIHIEYLQNLGVRASLVVALTEQGKLWGLATCHHYRGPLALAPRLRGLCALLCEVFSAQLTLRLAAAHAAELDALAGRLDPIDRRAEAVATAGGGEGFASFVSAIGEELAGYLHADGLWVRVDGDEIKVGSTPRAEQIAAMVSAAHTLPQRGRSGVVSCDDLPACGCVPTAAMAGFAFATVLGLDGAIMAVRREHVIAQTWAGDPHKSVAASEVGRIHPRRSFERRRVERRDRCRPWTETDCGALRMIVNRLWRWRSVFEQARRVTLIRRLEESGAEARQLALVVECTSTAVIITDADGMIVWVNDAFSRLSGFMAGEAIGCRKSILHGPLTDPVELARVQAARGRRESIRATLVFYTRSGEPFWADIQSAPIVDDLGAQDRYICVLHDVSEARAREAALQTALARAKESDRLKEEFLNVLSHEVRTPLNGVLGGLAVITADIKDGPKFAMAQEMRKSAQALLEVFGGMLDLARRRAEAAEPVFAYMAPAASLDEACATIRAAAEQKGLALRTEVAKDVPLLRTDARLLRQILINFLSNALKFTTQGEIVARIEMSDLNERGVVFSVEDTGPGVPETLRARVFDPFFQINGGPTRSNGGAGLGLAISRDFATKLGGKIGVSSSPSGGAKFWLELPVGTHAPNSHDRPRMVYTKPMTLEDLDDGVAVHSLFSVPGRKAIRG